MLSWCVFAIRGHTWVLILKKHMGIQIKRPVCVRVRPPNYGGCCRELACGLSQLMRSFGWQNLRLMVMGFVSRSQTLAQLARGRNVATTMSEKDVVMVQ